MSDDVCEHLSAIESIRLPDERVCVDCVPIGGRWVHLRTCQTCGLTRCCDSSPNRHASGHARESGHPVVASAEPNERWLWCYVDEAAAEY
ncbi:MAG: UBP-type zinc finger domain-containing protein [Sandaracinaceae bacterium]